MKKSQQDWESRWENVQELITFATEVGTDLGPEQLGTATVGVTVQDNYHWVDGEQEGGVDVDEADVFGVIDLTSDEEKEEEEIVEK